MVICLSFRPNLILNNEKRRYVTVSFNKHLNRYILLVNSCHIKKKHAILAKTKHKRFKQYMYHIVWIFKVMFSISNGILTLHFYFSAYCKC